MPSSPRTSFACVSFSASSVVFHSVPSGFTKLSSYITLEAGVKPIVNGCVEPVLYVTVTLTKSVPVKILDGVYVMELSAFTFAFGDTSTFVTLSVLLIKSVIGTSTDSPKSTI